MSIETPGQIPCNYVSCARMKRLLPKTACFLSLAILAALPLRALETDVLLGLNADVAPFGIESILPGGALVFWPWDDLPLSPGADAEFYLWTDRLEFSSHLYLRANIGAVSPFAGAGAIYLKGDYFGHQLTDWYPEAMLGLRAVILDRLVLCPVISVRIKPEDTDKNVIGLAGVSF